MKSKFDITGLFYEVGGYKCRKLLDIKRSGSRKRKPDLMVIMMNPGSSYPLNGIDNNSEASETEPDNTQLQIMKVMESSSFDYARILNLSDLRTPDSSVLYKFLKSKKSKKVDHSIFSVGRREELERLFIRNVPAIYGWGVNSALIPLAKQAIDALNIEKPLGLLKAGTLHSYYHPLPRIYEKQLEWVDHVSRQAKCV